MSKRRTFLKVIAAFAGVGVLVVGSCAGLLYAGWRNAEKNASPRVDAMLSAIQDGTFADTYDTEAAQELRDSTTKAQYETMGNAIALRLGAIQSKSLRNFMLRQFNLDSFLEVTYDGVFEKGNGTIRAKLKRQGADWKFVHFAVDSPLFEQDVVTSRCASCGEPHAAGARFCPSCGAKLSSADGDDSGAAKPDPNAKPSS